MKIDPSTISTNLDYGHSSDQDSEGNQQQRKRSDADYSPILPHDDYDQESANAKRLAARKARKKKRKIAERKARQENQENEDEL